MGRPLAKQPELPDLETLNVMLRYDEGTGLLFWRNRLPETFPADGRQDQKWQANLWASRFAGKRAGGMTGGYHRVMIGAKHHMAHRIIWKMKTGEDPVFIDHVDGDRSNNRFDNLRNVPHSVNMKNKSLYVSSKTGVPGVEYHSRDKVWRSKIGFQGHQINLGSFPTREEAIAARLAGQAVLDYHANHGRSKQEFEQ